MQKGQEQQRGDDPQERGIRQPNRQLQEELLRDGLKNHNVRGAVLHTHGLTKIAKGQQQLTSYTHYNGGINEQCVCAGLQSGAHCQTRAIKVYA